MRVLLGLVLALWAGAAASATSPEMSDLAFAPHPGALVPLDQTLRDDDGALVTLRALLAGRPAVLSLGYYTCPNLCGVVRNDLAAAIATSGLRVPQDLGVLALSIDPGEGVRQAAEAKQAGGSTWHFLTGDARDIAGAVGFRSRRDGRAQQFLHPAGVVVLTPAGLVSRYLQGVGYDPESLRDAIRSAAGEAVAPAPAPVFLFCWHYDAASGRYSLDVLRAVQVACGLTVVAIGGALLLGHRGRRA